MLRGKLGNALSKAYKKIQLTTIRSNILEGESLFNDGIGVVLFNISVFYLLTWIKMGWTDFGLGVLMFLKFAIGGALIGSLLGFLVSHLTKLFDDYPIGAYRKNHI